MNDVLTNILLSILTLDTIRSVIAMLGWVKPECKFAWIFYGRYDRNILEAALKDLGYSKERRISVIEDLKTAAKKNASLTGINKNNAAVQLIILLSKYTENFSKTPIQYGGSTLTNSSYYIDTMEISHSKKDLDLMAAIMLCLIQSNLKNKPEVVLVPKGGNPLFAQAVASNLNADLIVVKSNADKSKITTADKNSIDLFKINYEGSWSVLKKEKYLKTVVLDCNTSGGSQLMDIITGTNWMIDNSNGQINLKSPQQAFVLFCADRQGEQIDDRFTGINSKLIRYFDLDESTKKMLYQLKEQCQNEDRLPDYYIDSDREKAEAIIDKLKQNNKYYYK